MLLLLLRYRYSTLDRIRRFIGRRIYIPVTLWFLSGIRMAGVYFLVIAAFMVPSETEYVVDWGWMFTLLFIMGAFVDVAIAIALVANLYTHRKHVFSPTQKMLDRLIRWTVQTGLVTSIVAVAVVICFQTMKSNLIWLTIYTCLGEVYSNSFMAILNARNGFQNDDTLYEVSVPAGILFPDASASGDTESKATK
ncbi:hypothetical protein BT96DRAFT_349575 [Gymnopus androsaceus JB14]|uniref:DUF6534 domain-containing protein n=1 Tax=Gymnopus androsaceus JB14 TaxID=1447944 RepID=A0A6A4GX06_9AGAR|nr:hypothetical protein BT96DRAFT_349575 [Gymnopus androsaceus JB14]